jgi:hypothetical protein
MFVPKKPRPGKPSPAVLPKDVRAARSYLRMSTRGRASDIPPRKFAAAAKENHTDFPTLLKFISRIYAGGSDQETYRMQQLSEVEK